MKTKILRNIFITVSVLFASAQLLAAGTSAGVSNLSKTPLIAPQPTFVTFDPPGGPARETQPNGINPAGAITGTYVRRERGRSRLSARSRWHLHVVRSPGFYWYHCRGRQ